MKVAVSRPIRPPGVLIEPIVNAAVDPRVGNIVGDLLDLGALMRLLGLGRQVLELRIEAFNLLSTVNYGAPAATAGAANFGTITSALDPRVVQLAVKFSF